MKELIASYEERIAELMRQVQGREELLSNKRQKGTCPENSSRTNFWELYRCADVELFHRRVIKELRFELERTIKENVELRAEL